MTMELLTDDEEKELVQRCRHLVGLRGYKAGADYVRAYDVRDGDLMLCITLRVHRLYPTGVYDPAFEESLDLRIVGVGRVFKISNAAQTSSDDSEWQWANAEWARRALTALRNHMVLDDLAKI